MTNPADLIRRFFADLSLGQLSDLTTTPDMTAWTLSGGAADKGRFAGGVGLLRKLFDGGLNYDVQSVISKEDRAAAQVHARGTFTDGEAFEADYAFLFQLHDGRVSDVREYADVEAVRQKIVPRIEAMMRTARE